MIAVRSCHRATIPSGKNMHTRDNATTAIRDNTIYDCVKECSGCYTAQRCCRGGEGVYMCTHHCLGRVCNSRTVLAKTQARRISVEVCRHRRPICTQGNKEITDPAALFFLARKRKPPFHQVSTESTPLTASHSFSPSRRFGNSP